MNERKVDFANDCRGGVMSEPRTLAELADVPLEIQALLIGAKEQLESQQSDADLAAVTERLFKASSTLKELSDAIRSLSGSLTFAPSAWGRASKRQRMFFDYYFRMMLDGVPSNYYELMREESARIEAECADDEASRLPGTSTRH